MAAATMRWHLYRHLQQLRARWRAHGQPEAVAHIPLRTAYLTPEQERDAISHACRTLDAVPQGDMRRGQWRPTISTLVRCSDGLVSWVKIACVSKDDPWFQAGELTAGSITGAPKPDILRDFEWTAGGREWHAIQFSLAPSPAVLGQPSIAEPPLAIDDQWLIELKRAIDAVNKTPLSRWHVHPGRIARTIGQRFGSKAPYTVDEWQTAHGDLNWGNVTAPNLMLLDWEFWGAAPRGFDAASLLSHSLLDPQLSQRIAATFAGDLDTPSGLVARLYQYARRLKRIEAIGRDPRAHRILEAEARRLLRL